MYIFNSAYVNKRTSTVGAQRSVRLRYEDMRDALNATGRPIVFSMCEWGVSSPWTYGREVREMPGCAAHAN